MKKVISGAVVIALLFAIMIPARYFGAFAEASQTLFINEVMSSNVSTIRDGDVTDPKHGSKGGAYSDWIEIYNAGPYDVDLTGYILADSRQSGYSRRGLCRQEGIFWFGRLTRIWWLKTASCTQTSS